MEAIIQTEKLSHIYSAGTPFEHGALVEYKPVFKMNNHFENEINAFVDCIKTGKKLPSHIDTVVITAKMMQAIYDSADAHREVVMD